VKQKNYIEDKDEAIPQIIEMFEGKVNEETDSEENKEAQAKAKKKWEGMSKIYK
jgi:hypothetical protein